MKILKSLPLVISSFLSVAPVFATEPSGDDVKINKDAPPTISQLADVFDNVWDLVLPVAGIVCVIFIIVGGYMWIMSAGDPSKVKQAQGTLTWSIIGLVFIILAALIIKTVIGAVE